MPETKKSRLTLYICIGIVAAVGIALLFPHFAMKLHAGGEGFSKTPENDGRSTGDGERHEWNYRPR